MKTAPISINIFKNSIWNLFLFASQGVTGIATSILIARYLGPELMGEYSYIIWLIGVIALVISLGLPNTITKFLSEIIGGEHKEYAKIIYAKLLQIQFIIALTISIILMIVFYKKLLPGTRDCYLIAFLSLIPVCMSMFLTAVFHGLQNFRITSIVGSAINLFQLVLVILFIKLDAGLEGLVSVLLISGIVQMLILVKWINPTFGFTSSFKIPKELRNKVTRYSLNVYWTIVLSMIVWQKSEIFFLKIFSTAEEIAFYSISFNMVMILIGLATLFSTVIFPILSNFHGAGDRKGIQNIYNKSIKAIFIFFLPICIFFIATAKPLVLLMYSSQYYAVYPLLIILVVSAVFSAVGIVFAHLIFAVNRADIQAKYVTLQAIINILLDLLLIPHYGATGAALANSSIRIASFPIWLWIIQKQLGFSFPFREVYMSILPNIPLALILCLVGNYYPNTIGIVLVFFIALFIYPLLLFAFKTITSDDIRIAKEVSTVLPAPYEKIVNVVFDKLPMRQEIT